MPRAIYRPVFVPERAYARGMDEHEQDVLRGWLERLSPEGRAAFFEIFDRLADLGLRRMAERGPSGLGDERQDRAVRGG